MHLKGALISRGDYEPRPKKPHIYIVSGGTLNAGTLCTPELAVWRTPEGGDTDYRNTSTYNAKSYGMLAAKLQVAAGSNNT